MDNRKLVGWLLAIGGLNLGLTGLGYFLKTDLNVLHMLLKSSMALESIVYVVIGIAAVWKVMMLMGKK